MRKLVTERSSPAATAAKAVQLLGAGFLAHRRNNNLRRRLDDGSLSASSYFRQLVRTALRLRFARLAEECGLSPAGAALDDCPLFSGTTTPDIRRARLPDDAVQAASQILGACSESDLGAIYESLLDMRPEIDVSARTFSLHPARGGKRKDSGSYYTPPAFVDVLLDWTLEPVIEQALAGSKQKAGRERALLDLKICDPAAGCGRFLIAAARRLAIRLAQLRGRNGRPSRKQNLKALRDVISSCIYGVDLDPDAVELCKAGLWLEAGDPKLPLRALDSRIKCGNGLLGATGQLLEPGIPDAAYKPHDGDDRAVCRALARRNREERAKLPTGWLDMENAPGPEHSRLVADAWCAAFVQSKHGREARAITTETLRRIAAGPGNFNESLAKTVSLLARQYRFFHWQFEFPEVLGTFQRRDTAGDHQSRGFDAVLGNPPFVNAIEGGIDDRLKRFLAHTQPGIGGTADLAGRFLVHGLGLLKPGGALGMVQPRAMLNAPALRSFRADPGLNFKPSMVYVPQSPYHFKGAAVFTCLVSMQQAARCRVAFSEDPATAEWKSGEIAGENWWLAAQQILGNVPAASLQTGPKLAGLFDVRASMTAKDAYDVKPLVYSSLRAQDLKLATTGLIDPRVCLWGKQDCRFLKSDYRYPRVRESRATSSSLKQRLARSHRPKIIVAGLSRRIECFVDTRGEYIGAVSTYTIYHPEDSLLHLHRLCDYLLSEQIDTRFRAELGANALGGGNTTMSKRFLMELGIPPAPGLK